MKHLIQKEKINHIIKGENIFDYNDMLKKDNELKILALNGEKYKNFFSE